jgi:hypothetical protein
MELEILQLLPGDLFETETHCSVCIILSNILQQLAAFRRILNPLYRCTNQKPKAAENALPRIPKQGENYSRIHQPQSQSKFCYSRATPHVPVCYVTCEVITTITIRQHKLYKPRSGSRACRIKMCFSAFHTSAREGGFPCSFLNRSTSHIETTAHATQTAHELTKPSVV